MLRFLIADKTLTSYESTSDQNLEFVDDILVDLYKSLVYIQVLHIKICLLSVSFSISLITVTVSKILRYFACISYALSTRKKIFFRFIECLKKIFVLLLCPCISCS